MNVKQKVTFSKCNYTTLNFQNKVQKGHKQYSLVTNFQ